MLPYDTLSLNGRLAAYKIFGGPEISIVVEMGLGACMGEWWHIAQRLQSHGGVLLYERAGVGSSSPSQEPRTPKRIAQELKALLDALPHAEQVIIIAHSQGGLYAQQFARLYPSLVRGLVLLDPLSANDVKFRERLSPEEFQKSGVDKSNNLLILQFLAKLRLGFVIKALLKGAPPFYYYPNFDKEARRYILDSQTKPAAYKTALEEYRLSHDPNELRELKTREGFPDVPLMLITHSSDVYAEEIMEFGGTTSELALKIEDLWQDIMMEYLPLCSKSMHTQACKSGHYIHLTEPELLEEGIGWVEKKST